jgi:hypothetical protein
MVLLLDYSYFPIWVQWNVSDKTADVVYVTKPTLLPHCCQKVATTIQVATSY